MIISEAFEFIDDEDEFGGERREEFLELGEEIVLEIVGEIFAREGAEEDGGGGGGGGGGD